MDVNSRFSKAQWRSTLPLENAVDEQPILAVADEKEVVALVLVADLHVLPRDERGVSHVDVDVAVRGAVSSNHQSVGESQFFEQLVELMKWLSECSLMISISNVREKV